MSAIAAVAMVVTSCGTEAAPEKETVTITVPTTVTVQESPESADSTAGPDEFRMSGAIELRSSFDTILDSACTAAGQFKPMQPGGTVTVYDAQGTVLRAGTIIGDKLDGGKCVLTWAASGIPAGVGPYQYEVAGVGKWTANEDAARAGTLRESIG